MSSQTIGTARVDIVANADGVEVAAAKAKTSIANMSTSAQQQYENLTKRQQRSIETLMRQVDTVGMAREEQLAYNVAMRTTGALQQELLGRLKASQSGFQQQASAMKYGELSAKQYAAAMRGVPAQITDIAVSLQGGQRPLTVFLQQGGQLKDMFGGVVPAARALSSTFLGMINPVTVLGAGVTALGVAWYQGSRELDGLNQHLIMTGNSIGLTTNQVSEMAMELDRLPGITRSGAAEALTQITRTGKIAGEQLALVSEVALQANRLLGKEVSATVEEFAKLAEDPVKSVMELNKQYNFLTLSVYDQIRALEEQGRTQDAATLATETMASVTLERLGEVESSQGYLQKGWGIVTTTAKEAWDAMLGIGRVKTGSEIADAAQQSIDTALRTLESLRLSEVTTYAEIERSALSGANKAAAKDALAIIQQAEQKLEDLRREQAGADFTASAQSFASKQVEEEHARREALEKLLEDGRTRQQIYADEVAAEKKRWESISAELEVGSAEYQAAEKAHLQIIKNIDEKFKERSKGRSGASAYQTEMARLQARAAEEQNLASALAQSGSQFERLNEFERRASQLRNLAATETKASTKAEYERLATLNEQVGAQVRANKATEEAIKERNRYLDGLEKSVKQTKEEALRISDQAKTVGLSRTAIEELTTARLREKAAQLQGIAGSEAELELLNQQIAARDELVKAISQHEVAQATYKAQQESIQEWEKTVDQYGDVFRQGFADMLNNGKDGWKSFTTSLVTTFKTSVADQIYKMFAQPFVARVAVGVSGLLGGGAAAAASAQGAGSIDPLTGASFASKMMSGAGASQYGMVGGMSWFNNFGGNISNTIADWGANLAMSNGALSNFGGTLLNNAEAIGKFAEGAGAVFNYGKGIYDITQGKWGGGIGAIGGQLLGGPIGGMIGGALGGMLDGAFKGETRSGGGFVYDPNSRQAMYHSGPSGGYGGQQTLSAVEGLFSSAADTIVHVFEGAGVDAGLAFFHGAFESSSKGRGGTFSGGDIVLADGTVIGFGGAKKGDGFGGKSGSAEEMFQNLQSEVHFAALEAWKAVGSEMPSMISNMLNGIDIRSLGAEQAQALVAEVTNTVSGVNALSDAFNQMPMANLRDLTFDATGALMQFAGGLDAITSGVSTYYQNFYSESERQMQSLSGMASQLSSLNASFPITKAGFRELADGLDLSTESGQKLYAALMSMSGAAASFYDHIEQQAESSFATISASITASRDEYLQSLQRRHQAAQKAVRDEYAAKTAAIRNSVTSVNERLRDLNSVFSALGTGIKSLRDQSELASQLHREASLRVIEDAIKASKAGKSLTNIAQLQDSIQSASKLDANNFTSLFDFELERAETVNRLKELESLTGGQIDVQELQLESLNKQLEQLSVWQDRQLELLQIQHESAQSRAHERFERMMEEEKAQFEAQLAEMLQQQANQLAINDSIEAGAASTAHGLSAVQAAIDASAARIASAVSSIRVDVSLGGQRLPAFADGGYYRGGLALVGERGPEIINFAKPGMVYTAAQSKNLMAGGDNKELVGLLRQLIAMAQDQSAELRSVALSISQVLGVLRDVTQGGTELRTKEVIA